MCKEHDREVFKPIDNNSFADDKQKLFLQSVRAFFFSYYRTRVYQQRNFRYLEAFQDSISLDLEELKVTRFEKNKAELENAIHQGTNNNLAFLRWSVPHICPIACSSWTIIHLSINDSFITVNDGSIKTGYPIILTILPSKKTNSTSVVLGRFISDIGSECIFNQFQQKCKNHDEFGRLISNLVLRASENFYLNPAFYNNLCEMDKKTIESLGTEKSAFFSGDKIDFSKQFNFFDVMLKIDVQR